MAAKLKRFVVKYAALFIVEAKNPNEAFAIADEEMTNMVESDELELDDIFAIEVTNDKIHDLTEPCTCGIGGGVDDADDDDADEDDADEVDDEDDEDDVDDEDDDEV